MADEAVKALSLEKRWWLLLGIISVMGLSMGFVLRLQGWKQWLALLVVSLVVALIANYGGGYGFTEILGVFWIIFLILFIPMYITGWLTAWLLYHSPQQAHQAIYKSAFAFAFAFAVAVAVAFTVAGAFIGMIIILQQWAARHSYSKPFWFVYTSVFLVLGFLSLYYTKHSGYMLVLT